MAFDLQTVESKLQQAKDLLTKAQADVDYWQKARDVIADLRAADLLNSTSETTRTRPYGELKSSVFDTLPRFDENPPLTTGDIASLMLNTGYVFTSANPLISVNEALRALEVENKAVVVCRSGVSKLWKKSACISTDLINEMASLATEEEKQEHLYTS